MVTESKIIATLTAREEEVLGILQEECSELVQVISKIRRFGVFDVNPKQPSKGTNAERFVQEMGDILECLDDLVKGPNTLGLTSGLLVEAMANKRKQLRQYSTHAKEDYTKHETAE